jgi:hypothetical protein
MPFRAHFHYNGGTMVNIIAAPRLPVRFYFQMAPHPVTGKAGMQCIGTDENDPHVEGQIEFVLDPDRSVLDYREDQPVGGDAHYVMTTQLRHAGNLEPEDLPVTISAYRTDTDEEVWREVITQPTALYVPPLARIHGCPIKVVVEFANGAVTESIHG